MTTDMMLESAIWALALATKSIRDGNYDEANAAVGVARGYTELADVVFKIKGKSTRSESEP